MFHCARREHSQERTWRRVSTIGDINNVYHSRQRSMCRLFHFTLLVVSLVRIGYQLGKILSLAGLRTLQESTIVHSFSSFHLVSILLWTLQSGGWRPGRIGGAKAFISHEEHLSLERKPFGAFRQLQHAHADALAYFKILGVSFRSLGVFPRVLLLLAKSAQLGGSQLGLGKVAHIRTPRSLLTTFFKFLMRCGSHGCNRVRPVYCWHGHAWSFRWQVNRHGRPQLVVKKPPCAANILFGYVSVTLSVAVYLPPSAFTCSSETLSRKPSVICGATQAFVERHVCLQALAEAHRPHVSQRGRTSCFRRPGSHCRSGSHGQYVRPDFSSPVLRELVPAPCEKSVYDT
jgi:hypothetical protein